MRSGSVSDDHALVSLARDQGIDVTAESETNERDAGSGPRAMGRVLALLELPQITAKRRGG